MDKKLSIHDLTRRSTAPHTREGAHPAPFNSRPHEEVDTITQQEHKVAVIFQFTTSRGGRLWKPSCSNMESKSFNSRPHEEVDVCSKPFWVATVLSIHDLTRRSTYTIASPSVIFSFQFTTSRGGRHNSSQLSISPRVLSIHDLTRRSTCAVCIIR